MQKEGEVSIISDVMEQVNKPEKKQLKGKLRTGTVALIIALIAVASATYAWYVYNTNRHTTKVRMAAGAGVNLQISNSYSVTYGSAAVLDSFSGQLNPVSTNRISGGFQKVLGFTNGTENQPNLVANLFGRGDYTDYYQTSLFLRSRTFIWKLDEMGSTSGAQSVLTVPRSSTVVSSISNGQASYVDDPAQEISAYMAEPGDTEDTYKDGSQMLVQLDADEVASVEYWLYLEGCDEQCSNPVQNRTSEIQLAFAGVDLEEGE